MPDTRVDRKSRPKASPKRQSGTATEVLRARPVKGKIDHDALSQEFMARFPKIRAALAR